ncbi:flagellar basal body rod protein FlgB [Temperatibacter marinus]|uniref:Flagellar basal body rod protein FlgB n=1 Tax=Temperatibacter marinus TaxID=1456591 RepID=A0AA52EEE6_9PROT|nr:flagellar basal body rod protein FlgB [Temperatibacter marinus]WND02143.1 flagellar basal body rod protein FlgB [Temperatibacter marinus]
MVDYSTLPMLTALKDKMRWLNANQRVISENIAHADTPGYRAKEIAEQDFSGLVDSLSGNKTASASSFKLAGSDPGHIGQRAQSNGSYVVNEQKGNEESPTGNSVVLEEEMIKLADNQMQYGMASRLYKKNVALIKAALGKSGR